MRALPGYFRVTHCRGYWICVRPNLTFKVMEKAEGLLLNAGKSASGYKLSEQGVSYDRTFHVGLNIFRDVVPSRNSAEP